MTTDSPEKLQRPNPGVGPKRPDKFPTRDGHAPDAPERRAGLHHQAPALEHLRASLALSLASLHL